MKNHLSAIDPDQGMPNPKAQQYQHVLDSLLAFVFTVDKNGRFRFVNGVLQAFCGYSYEDLTGQSFLMIIADEDVENTKQFFSKQVAGGNILHFENRFKKKDGTIVPVSWAARWDERDEMLYCVVRDITERKLIIELHGKYENELKKRNREMLDMLERITDGFFVLDNEWRFVYANHRAEEIAGTSLEDVLTKTMWECFPGTVGTDFESYYRKAVAEQIPVSFEAYYPAPLNTWLDVSAYPSANGLSVFIRDVSERKRIELERAAYEQKIKEQNNQLSEILESITDAFYSVDKNWRVTYWNRRAEELAGKPRDQMLGKNLWECIPNALGTDIEHNFRKAFKKQQPVHFEAFSALKPILLEFSVYPSKNGLTVFYRDISEKRKTEEEVKLLSLIAKETVNAVWIMDTELKIRWVNEAFTRTTGYTFAEASGCTPAELLKGPETDEGILKTLVETISRGNRISTELINYTKDKRKKYVLLNVQPVFNHENTISSFFVIQTDLTEQRKTQEELELLSLIAKETDSAVTMFGPDGKIAWVNEAYTRITGYSMEEVIGHRNSELLCGPDSDVITFNRMMKQFNNAHPFNEEIICYMKNGERKWLQMAGQPILDKEGNLQRYFIIQTDISERKRLEEELEIQRKKTTAAVIIAQEKERSQVGQELHDNVNQVLTTIKLYIELCRDGIGDPKEIMDKSISLLQESIEEIRSLSRRLSAPSLGKIRLKDSVKELINSIRFTNKINIIDNIDFIEHLEVSHELHLAVYRILQEHLTNILKHADASEVHLEISYEYTELILKVSDNGKGFNPGNRRNGIGITNMLTRAESVHGALMIDSSPGRGCTLIGRFAIVK